MQANAATAQGERLEQNDPVDTSYSNIVIIRQPQSQSVPESQSLQLFVEALSETPLNYQWFKNNEPVSGATEASLIIDQSKLEDSGLYHVLLSNNDTEMRSLSANISITTDNSSFSLAYPLQGQTLPAGDPLYLSIELEGQGPFQYQWQKNGSVIPNATKSFYFVAETQKSDEASYRVAISNGIKTIYSNFVNVWITDKVEPISIVNHPQSQLLPDSSSTVLSVSASGGGFITYQWRKNGVPIDKAFSATLSLTDLTKQDEGYYDVVVANSQGSQISNKAFIEILSTEPTLVINQQPLSQLIGLGQAFSLSVSAISEQPLAYQWYHNDVKIAGANSPTYHVLQPDFEDAGHYSVEISDTYSSVRSIPATITLYEPGMYAIELSWDTPKTREDGSLLANDEILEYVIEYGYEDNLLNHRITIPHQSVNSYVLDGIYPGRLLLRIATVDIDGHQGHFSDVISLSID